MAWSDTHLDAIFESDCHLCGGEVRRSHYGRIDSRFAWEVDHDIPVAVGGDDDLDNLKPAHPSCNRAKGSMASEDFREMLEASIESPAAPILAMSVGAGLIAGSIEKDATKKVETGLKWAVGTGLGLMMLGALASE
jgi:hypothetical protein